MRGTKQIIMFCEGDEVWILLSEDINYNVQIWNLIGRNFTLKSITIYNSTSAV